MAPRGPAASRRGVDQNHASTVSSTSDVLPDLFLDPMLGTPLAMYVEKDVHNRDTIVSLITKHGGTVSPGYSGVPYILVDPLRPSGQSLYRQYAGKKAKIVLNAQWVHECIKAGQLQTFHTNWAGCKVTGNETASPTPAEILSQPPQPQPSQPQPQHSTATAAPDSPRRRNRQSVQAESARQVAAPPPPIHPSILHSTIHVDSMVHAQSQFPPYQLYVPPPPPPPPPSAIHPPRSIHAQPPPQTWQGTGIAPQQTHIAAPPQLMQRPPYREDAWDGYDHTHSADPMNAGGFDYRYREPSPWGPASGYYESTPVQFEQTYDQTYMEEAAPEPAATTAPVSTVEEPETDKTRGRRRTRGTVTPAAPASSLVVNRNPLARSPTPPTRTVKSTYGGNLFTAEDVDYLKRYIDYCQDQGLVLSLREICERIAVKAPHHTFYSWRRYCNKHQIRLGGYAMNPDRSETPPQQPDDQQDIVEEEDMHAGPGPGTIAAAQQRMQEEPGRPRNRSPTPPRALFRSTTGKGVAFTDEDVAFLVRFMEYRKSQGRFDTVVFWKDVATKAPHHSRASWMKFWRRHKHEFNRTDTDEPLPQPPDKKMRYSREDDILLAKHFFTKPEGTSDKIFQAFARRHPHHPWKGWQEHHRIHKTKIDHFIEMLKNGEDIDVEELGLVE